MGKTKIYFDPEQEQMQGFKSSASTGLTRSRSTRKQSQFPGRIVQDGPDVPPLPILLGQVWLRFKRMLVVFRYRFNLYTMGLFKKQFVLKAATLCMIGWVVFLSGWIGSSTENTSEPDNGTSIFSFFGGGKSDTKAKARKTNYSGKNEAAPVSASQLFQEEAESYIERFAPIAREEMRKYGVPASISLAQGLIESRAGTSKLAKNNNNHFGIKCFSRHCKKGHCSNFTDDTHKDFFRKFQNPWESWREHSIMLSKGRYKKLHKYGSDYRNWAYGLKSIGYATDRTYSTKLIEIIERYDLHKFDR